MNSIICSPSECTDQDLTSFEELVIDGGAVDRAGLSGRIRSALQLLFLRSAEGVLAGIGALKRPSLGYRTKIFNAAGSLLDANLYTLELGWVVVDNHYRGQRLPSRIVSDLLSVVGNERLFATTRADKAAMHYALGDNSFAREGVPFASDRDDYELVLYIRPG
jgi:hypothetical protein